MACLDQRPRRTCAGLRKVARENRLQRDPVEMSQALIVARVLGAREVNVGQRYWSLTTLLCPIASRAVVPCPQVIVLPLQQERACFGKSGWCAIGCPL